MLVIHTVSPTLGCSIQLQMRRSNLHQQLRGKWNLYCLVYLTLGALLSSWLACSTEVPGFNIWESAHRFWFSAIWHLNIQFLEMTYRNYSALFSLMWVCVSCPRILPEVVRRSEVQKGIEGSLRFKFLESISLGFLIIAVIFGNLYTE